jgi:hypothetical protein
MQLATNALPELGFPSRRALRAAALTIAQAGGPLDTCTIGAGTQLSGCIQSADWPILIMPSTCQRPLLMREALDLVEATGLDVLVLRLDTALNPASFVTFDAIVRRYGSFELFCDLRPCIVSDGELWLVREGSQAYDLRLGPNGLRLAPLGNPLEADERDARIARASEFFDAKCGEDCDMKRAAQRRAAGAAWSEFLFLNPLGNWPHYAFGVLRRRTAKGKVNTATDFGRAKLHPVDPPPASAPFRPTAARWECLIPPRAPDALLDPSHLLTTYDAQGLEWRRSLLTYVTLRFPDEDRLHAAFEAVRAWAMTEFVEQHGAPVLLIQHAPHLVGSPRPHHVHCLVIPRMATGLGWGAYCDDALTEDGAQKTIYDSWLTRSGR